MNRIPIAGAFAVLSTLSLGCAAANSEATTTGVLSQTAGRTERFNQFELDVEFRKQSRENVKVLDPEGDLNVCCVLFYSEVQALSNVFAHFKQNVAADVNDYGVVIQENEKHYVVHFWERYKESTQYLARGYWHPGTSEPGLIGYGYVVDRETLEVLEFTEVLN